MKMAFVGASGYGNVGDDTYPILWKRYLPNVEVCIYNSDRPEGGLDSDTDLVVFGGGGLMWHHEGNAHFEYMSYYAKEAKRLGIPCGFSSCDFQFVRSRPNREIFETENTMGKWLPILRDARFIILRSRNSVDLLKAEGVSAEYAPDLAYLFRPGDTMKPRNTITVIPAGGVAADNTKAIEDIRQAQEMWPDARLIYLNMGGPGDDKYTSRMHSQSPGSTALFSDQVDPVRALDIIGRSHIVFSGRYHGMVFARNCGTPCRTYPLAQYKIAVDPPEDEAGDPWRNILVLSREIASLRP